MRSRSREQGAGAERAGSVSEEQAVRERAGSSGSRSKEHKCEEQGARGARCARAIGACIMLVAVRSAVEQALQWWESKGMALWTSTIEAAVMVASFISPSYLIAHVYLI